MYYDYNNTKTANGCLAVVVVIVLLFIVVDMASGSNDLRVAQLTDKRYVPEHSYTVTHTDAKTGNSYTTWETDPEEFILVVSFDGISREDSTSRKQYNQFMVGEKVFAKITKGGLSGMIYLRDVLKWQNPEGGN